MSCDAKLWSSGAQVFGVLHFTEITLVISGTMWWTMANWKCLVGQRHLCVIFMGTIMQEVRRHFHVADPSGAWARVHVIATLVPSGKCVYFLCFFDFSMAFHHSQAISPDSQCDIYSLVPIWTVCWFTSDVSSLPFLSFTLGTTQMSISLNYHCSFNFITVCSVSSAFFPSTVPTNRLTRACHSKLCSSITSTQ